MLFECGEGAFRALAAGRFEAATNNSMKLISPEGGQRQKDSFLSVQKATLGTTGRCPPEPVPSFPAMLFECGEGAFRALAAGRFEAATNNSMKLISPEGGQRQKDSFLSVQKATLGTTGRCPEARSVLHCQEGMTGSKGQEARSKATALFSSFGSRAFHQA